MASQIKTITYTVGENGALSEKSNSMAPQYGGIQGEHDATQLVFQIDKEKVDLGVEDGQTLTVRVECKDGAGGYHSSGVLTLDNTDTATAKATYLIPQAITNAGGVAQFHLVVAVSTLDEQEKPVAENIRYSFPVQVYFKDSSGNAPGKDVLVRDVGSMVYNAGQLVEKVQNIYNAMTSSLTVTHRKDGNLYFLAYSQGSVIVHNQVHTFEAGEMQSFSLQNYIYLKPDGTLFADPSGTLVEDEEMFADYVLIGYYDGETTTVYNVDVRQHNVDEDAHPDLQTAISGADNKASDALRRIGVWAGDSSGAWSTRFEDRFGANAVLYEAAVVLGQETEANRFIHDVDIQYSGSTITSATYKYGAETKDITEALNRLPWSEWTNQMLYIREDGTGSTSLNVIDDRVFIAKITETNGAISDVEYLPIDQKTAGPTYEELKGEVEDLSDIVNDTSQGIGNESLKSQVNSLGSNLGIAQDSIEKAQNAINEITTATREISGAAYFDDLSAANPGMSISGLSENDTVYVYGRNLAPKIPAQTLNGLTLTQNADGSVTINGTATGDSSTIFSVSANVTLPAGATFTFSGCTTGSSRTYRMYVYQPGWQQCFLVHGGTSKPITNFAVTSKPITVTMTQTLPVTITVLVASGQTMDNVTLYPMCELGETTRGYVSYIDSATYTADSSGVVSFAATQPEATVITGKTCVAEYSQNTQIASENAERRINQTVTNALIGTKTGTVVRMDDVSPMPHNPQVEITGATADGTSVVNPVVNAYGKNLLDLDTYQMETQTINGVTLTNHGNGYFELTGTPTEAQTTQFTSSQFTAATGLNIYPPGTYTASEGVSVTIRKAADNSSIGNKSGTFTVDETFYISRWYVFVASSGYIGGTTSKTTPFGFRPQMEAGDTATEYEAYKEPQEYTYAGTLGTNNTFTVPTGTFDSVYPTMTMTVTNDNSGTVEGSLTIQYNRDINAAFAELMNAIAAQA